MTAEERQAWLERQVEVAEQQMRAVIGQIIYLKGCLERCGRKGHGECLQVAEHYLRLVTQQLEATTARLRREAEHAAS